MRFKLIFAALMLLFPLCFGAVRADPPTIRVLETYPAGQSVILARNQDFNLHLLYDTDKPIGIWITPYFHGREVSAGTSPSVTYSGQGDALAWFFLNHPGDRVDEIRIRAGDGGYGMPVVASYRVDVAGSDFPQSSAASDMEPSWLKNLREKTNREVEANMNAQYGSSGSSPGSSLFLGGFMLVVLLLALAGIAAPVLAIRRWQGGWRLAAVVPLGLLGFVILRIVAGTTVDPTSHNLWPFEILLAGLTNLGILAFLALVRRLFEPQN